MRFGVCVAPEQIETIARAGFDYCELPARAVLPLEDDRTALPALRTIAAAPIRPEAFNVLIPGTMPLVGPQADLAALRDYLRSAFQRMAWLGAAVVVLGSGAARRIPDDVDRAVALDQLADALNLAGDEAARAGIALALEHLNKGECNVFNSVAESLSFIRERGLTGVAVLADLHHMELEHEPFDSVVDAALLLVHVHVADGGRRAPGNGGYDYSGFMATLKQIGYDDRISAECSWGDLEVEAPAALAFMRRQWADATYTKE